MKTRTRNALSLGGALVVLGAGLAWVARERETNVPPSALNPADPAQAGLLAAAPGDAMLLVSADLAALRKIETLAPLFSQQRVVAGLGPVSEVCGFDPLDRIDNVVLTVPMGGEPGAFGVAASSSSVGAIDPTALATCAEKVIKARQGQSGRTKVGRFTIVRDEAAAGTSSGELAIRDDGWVLLSEGSYLGAMIDAAEGRAPNAMASPLHQNLRGALGDGAVVLSFVFSTQQRAVVARELAAAATPGGNSPPPLDAIEAIAASFKLEGDTVAVRGVARCTDAPSCQKLSAEVDVIRNQFAEAASQVGAGGPISRLIAKSNGRRLELATTLTPGELNHLVELALR